MTHRQIINTRTGRLSRTVRALFLPAVWVASGPASAQTLADVLRGYEAEALGSNPALRARAFSVGVAEQDLAEARADGRPSVRFDSRLTRAEGGRTIDLPLGQLLNPAYDALGALTGQPFPRLTDESIPLFRNEADARLRLTVPLYAPRVGPAVRLREALLGAETVGVEAARRDLVRDVRVGYLRLLQADRAVGILQASEALATENLRSSQALRRADRAIGAEVLRAEADVFAAERDRTGAVRDRDLALAAFNALLGRALDRPVVWPVGTEAADPPASPARPDIRLASTFRWSDAPLGADSLGALQDAAVAQRQELARLDAVIEARVQAAALASAAYRPVVGVSVEAGAQGSAVEGLFPDEPFVLASVGLSWELADGGRRRAQRERAHLEESRDRALREDAALQIRLQVEQAVRGARVARAQTAASQARLVAARERYRATTRLVAAGSANQVDAVDARTTLVEAELAVNVDRYGLLIELARLDAALGTPAPGTPASSSPDR